MAFQFCKVGASYLCVLKETFKAELSVERKQNIGKWPLLNVNIVDVCMPLCVHVCAGDHAERWDGVRGKD